MSESHGRDVPGARRRGALGALICAMLLALAVTGCGGSGSKSSGDSSSGETSGRAPKNLKSLAAELKKANSDEEWWKRVTSIEQGTELGSPVIIVRTDIRNTDSDSYGLASKIAEAVADLDPAFAPNVEVFGLIEIDGKDRPAPMGGSGSGGKMMTEKFDLPPVPQNAAELQSWLNKVYGKGGLVKLGPQETWLKSIKSIRMEPSPAGDGKSALVIRTTIPPTDRDQPIQQMMLLQKAIQSSGCPAAVEYWWFGSDNYSGLTSLGSMMLGGGAPFYPE